MNAKEIRETNDWLVHLGTSSERAKMKIQIEIAAQLADVNENFAKLIEIVRLIPR
jgi:hypothetical protein